MFYKNNIQTYIESIACSFQNSICHSLLICWNLKSRLCSTQRGAKASPCHSGFPESCQENSFKKPICSYRAAILVALSVTSYSDGCLLFEITKCRQNGPSWAFQFLSTKINSELWTQRNVPCYVCRHPSEQLVRLPRNIWRIVRPLHNNPAPSRFLKVNNVTCASQNLIPIKWWQLCQ